VLCVGSRIHSNSSSRHVTTLLSVACSAGSCFCSTGSCISRRLGAACQQCCHLLRQAAACLCDRLNITCLQLLLQ
jgi:hypothetical protein